MKKISKILEDNGIDWNQVKKTLAGQILILWCVSFPFVTLGTILSLAFGSNYLILISYYGYFITIFIAYFVMSRKKSSYLFLIPLFIIILGQYIEASDQKLEIARACEIYQKDPFCGDRDKQNCSSLGIKELDYIASYCYQRPDLLQKSYMSLIDYLRNLSIYGDDVDENGIRDDVDKEMRSLMNREDDYVKSLLNEAKYLSLILKEKSADEINKLFHKYANAKACSYALNYEKNRFDNINFQEIILNNHSRILLYNEKGKNLKDPVADFRSLSFWENMKLCETELESLKEHLFYYYENERYKKNTSKEIQNEFLTFLGLEDESEKKKIETEKSFKERQAQMMKDIYGKQESDEEKREKYLSLTERWKEQKNNNSNALDTNSEEISLEQLLLNKCSGKYEYALKTVRSNSLEDLTLEKTDGERIVTYEYFDGNGILSSSGNFSSPSPEVVNYLLLNTHNSERQDGWRRGDEYRFQERIFYFNKYADLKKVVLDKVYKYEKEVKDKGGIKYNKLNESFVVKKHDSVYELEIQRGEVSQSNHQSLLIKRDWNLKCNFQM